jgi:fructokinase
MQKTILSFGEILWDMLPTCTKLGGAPFNFIYRTNCLGERGIMVSRLGRDELGEQAMKMIRKLDMNTTYIQWDDERPTGTVKVSFDEDNNPDYVIIPKVAYDYIRTTDELLAIAAEADCLCFGTLIQRDYRSRQTLYQIIQVADRAIKLLDINLRKDCYSLGTVTASLEKADVLKLNDDEAAQLAKMLKLRSSCIDKVSEELLRRYHLACCVVTLGDRGAFAISADGAKSYIPGYEIELVDSLGAGDAFTAGFIHKYLRGAPLGECCRYGNAMGGIVATREGGTSPVSENDVSYLMSSDRRRIFYAHLAIIRH